MRATPARGTEGAVSHAEPAPDHVVLAGDTNQPVLGTTIGGVLRTAAEHAPDQVALTAGEAESAQRRQWRYAELFAGAERAARHLGGRFEPGEPVAVWAGNCPEWVQLEFAAGLAGLTLVPVNPAYQADELAYVLRHSRARGLFLAAEHRGLPLPPVLDQVRHRLPELREVIPLTAWNQFCDTETGGRCPTSIPAARRRSCTRRVPPGGPRPRCSPTTG